MSSETEIRPFRVEMPDEAIADLRRRVAATSRNPTEHSLYWKRLLTAAVMTATAAWGGETDG
jgi:hypothetical protein